MRRRFDHDTRWEAFQHALVSALEEWSICVVESHFQGGTLTDRILNELSSLAIAKIASPSVSSVVPSSSALLAAKGGLHASCVTDREGQSLYISVSFQQTRKTINVLLINRPCCLQA